MSVVQSSKVTITCDQCGVMASGYKSKISRFCSKRCYLEWVNAPVDVRFWRFLGETTDAGCIPWIGNRNARGYGVLSYNDGRVSERGHRLRILAHRLSWIVQRGPIADDIYVLHRCDNPTCVNIDHLFLGTRADNNADMKAKGRMARGEQCHRSHLKADDILAIRAAYHSGDYSQREIAERFGICQQTVHTIIARKSWSHI